MTILPLFDTSSYPNTSQPSTKRQKPNVNMCLDGYMFNQELRFVRKIGAGTYGLIYLVENIYTKKQFAAKMVLKQQPMKLGTQSPASSSSSKQLIQQQFYQYFLNHVIPKPRSIDFDYIKGQGHDCQFLTEIALHLQVHDHPNVVTIHEVFELENFAVVILLDHFDQGDLFENIIDMQIFQSRRSDREKQLMMKNAMLQLIQVVDYCHQKSIYHCDLKPENIMVKFNSNYKRQPHSPIIDYNELQLVLIDFGLALDSNLINSNMCRGSSFYMSPERVTNFTTSKLVKSLVNVRQFSTNVNGTVYLPTLPGDIWSLGVLFINITCSRNPWPIASFNEGGNDVFVNYMLKNQKDILRSILPISNQFNKILVSIFQLNPNERVGLHQLYKAVTRYDFFHDHDYFQPKPVQHKSNPQLYTPPDSLTYNSYASEFEMEVEDGEEEDMDEEEYDDDDEEEEEEEEDWVDAEEFTEVKTAHNCPIQQAFSRVMPKFVHHNNNTVIC
ncbi:SKS1 [Candida theae]|uniref:SKS1 n=1 Tax=Candida theae TaxID=1198502 RepID=A0AAD5BJD8_9ASCO|nr:SKS1 [Candida theae]KAI5967103.1 SKS1 [Candida theae]